MAVISGNFQDAKARKGGAGGIDLPTGYYTAKTVAVDDQSKPSSIMLQLVLTEPGFEGVQRRVYLGTDLSKAGNRNSWFTAWCAHGFDPNALTASPEAQIDTDSFIEADCVVFVKAKDPNVADSRDDVQFVTPEAYAEAQETQAQEEVQVAAPAAAPVAAPVAAPRPAPAVARPAAAPVAAPRPAAGGLKSLLAKRGRAQA